MLTWSACRIVSRTREWRRSCSEPRDRPTHRWAGSLPVEGRACSPLAIGAYLALLDGEILTVVERLALLDGPNLVVWAGPSSRTGGWRWVRRAALPPGIPPATVRRSPGQSRRLPIVSPVRGARSASITPAVCRSAPRCRLASSRHVHLPSPYRCGRDRRGDPEGGAG